MPQKFSYFMYIYRGSNINWSTARSGNITMVIVEVSQAGRQNIKLHNKQKLSAFMKIFIAHNSEEWIHSLWVNCEQQWTGWRITIVWRRAMIWKFKATAGNVFHHGTYEHDWQQCWNLLVIHKMNFVEFWSCFNLLYEPDAFSFMF